MSRGYFREGWLIHALSSKRKDKRHCMLVDAIEVLHELDRNDDESVAFKHTYMIHQIDHFTSNVANFN